ncbi:MAG: aminotransferase [Acidiferrobacterales bacterium]|nr:aminotransferase [Acidiferrobacterales bacterium]
MTSDSTQILQKQDNTFLHPWESIDELGKHTRTVMASGSGVYVTDTDGNRLLDGPAGMWCVNIGHHRKEMADAIAEQVMRLSYTSPWSLTNAPAAILAEKLSSISPGDLNHVFYTTGGSTAVDSALRFVMFRNNVLGKPDKKHIIARANGYHGSTYLAASASGKSRDKNFLDMDTERFHHISDPSMFDKPDDMQDAEWCQLKIDELEQKIISLGPDKAAAFIAEPILASGGVLIAPDGYHAACLAVCRKYDVLYISDEVVTAFGRLGHFFASESVFNIQPDIITCAKGITSGYIPLGAFLVSDRLIETIQQEQRGPYFSNGYTYSGHPVACAAALKNIEIMERENLLQHVQNIAPYFQSQLQTLKDIPIVSDVRGIGLMAAVECDISGDAAKSLEQDYAVGDRIDRHCQQLGLLVRPIINMCVMSPPLIIDKDQIDEMVSILRRGIELAMDDLKNEGLWSA